MTLPSVWRCGHVYNMGFLFLLLFFIYAAGSFMCCLWAQPIQDNIAEGPEFLSTWHGIAGFGLPWEGSGFDIRTLFFNGHNRLLHLNRRRIWPYWCQNYSCCNYF